MTQRSRTFLKGQFEQGDIPQGTDYEDLIDSFINLEASASQTMGGQLVLPDIATSSFAATGPSQFSNEIILPTGSTQGSAAAVTLDVFTASAEQNERALVLPTLQPGRIHRGVNTGTTALAIFPPSGENFVGTAANGGIEIAVAQGITIFHVVSAYAIVRG